eukprot:5499714-Heterocapsa_arctica.AAC.1
MTQCGAKAGDGATCLYACFESSALPTGRRWLASRKPSLAQPSNTAPRSGGGSATVFLDGFRPELGDARDLVDAAQVDGFRRRARALLPYSEESSM